MEEGSHGQIDVGGAGQEIVQGEQQRRQQQLQHQQKKPQHHQQLQDQQVKQDSRPQQGAGQWEAVASERPHRLIPYLNCALPTSISIDNFSENIKTLLGMDPHFRTAFLGTILSVKIIKRSQTKIVAVHVQCVSIV